MMNELVRNQCDVTNHQVNVQFLLQLQPEWQRHSQISTGNSKTQFLNEINRLSREYYYADHMNSILGVYTDLDEVTNLQCDYLETVEKCEHLEKELSKSRTMSKSFEALQKHAINLELDLQQCKKDKKMTNLSKKISQTTRQPIAVPISTREPKHNVNQSVATSSKKTVATDSTVKKSRNITRKLYEQTHFLRSKDETPEVLIDFLTLIQRGLHAQVRTVRTDKGTEFLNKTLHAYFAKEGIRHETSTARTPEQNGVVERQNRTLVEAAEMLSPLKFLWYSTQSRAFRVFNKRTRIIVETIHVNFDELPQMASDHVSSDPVPQGPTTVLEQDSLSPGPQSQENVPQVAETVTTSNELDLLFSPMFDELLNGTTPVVSKSSAVHAADAPNKRQQQHTTPSTSTTVVADTPPLNIQATPVTTSQAPTQVPTVTATENIIQAETNNENAQVDDDEFVNVFSTPVQDRGETSSRHVDSSNMHTFYQHHPSAQRWTKDHPLEQVIGNPSQSIRTRRQLETDGEMSFLYGPLKEEVYVNQPDGFVDPYHPDQVYRLKKALYGLKQAPRAWYDELSNFLVSKGFSKGSIDPTLFITKHGEDILLVQIYVDDIIFGSTNPKLSKRFEKLMHSKFDMSMMGELKFFLGIQIHQSPRGIFINQAKYAQEILKKHGMTSCDSIASRPHTDHATCNLWTISSETGPEKHLHCGKADLSVPVKTPLTWVLMYPKDHRFKLTAFSDSDHAGCLDLCKSTSGEIQFLGGDKLVSWSSKKQDCTSMSSSEAEYYATISGAASKYLWLRTQLTDYGFLFDKIPMYCDTKATIAISCNLVPSLDDGVAASFQRSRIHKPHAHTQAFKVNRSTSR
ncbi:retrovirus-related pol polyprotein from transposon TNT 1-94 [Tanacetum coccineum]